MVPKIRSNCYFIMLLDSDGLHPPILECEGIPWNNNDGAHSVFSPDRTKYARMNYQNGLHIYDFDNATGDLSNALVIDFPNDTFPTNIGVSISANSRFLYASAKKRLYQFDLHALDIEASRTIVAEWDGFANPFATIFNFSALAPDGKIYIASTSSTLNLHVIHKPDCPGLQCEVEQHGIELPAFNFITIPNFPHYRNEPTYINCDSMIITSTKRFSDTFKVKVFPNPVTDFLTVDIQHDVDTKLIIEWYHINGQKISARTINERKNQFDLSTFPSGIYFYKISNTSKVITTGKIIKVSK